MEDLKETFITTAFTGVVILALFALFRKIAPIGAATPRTDKSREELRKKYMRIDLVQLGLLVLISAIMTFVFFYVFKVILQLRVALYGEALLTVVTYGVVIVPAIFTGMLAAALIVMEYAQKKLGDDWDEYAAYNNMKYGFNYDKVGKIAMRIYAVLTVFLVVAVIDWGTVLRNDDIVVNSFFGLGSKTYKYTDVEEVREVAKTKAPSGDIVVDTHFVVVFKDGEKWNSRYSGFEDYNADSEIADIILDKTGKEIVELEFDR